MTELELWQSAADLGAHFKVHRSTVERCARGLLTATSDPRLLQVERRKPLPVERTTFARGLKWVYRCRPTALAIRKLAASPSEYSKLRETADEGPDLRDVEVKWRQFFLEHEGEEWVSLRAMVETGGLYEHFHHAKDALLRSELFFTSIREKSDGRGRPKEDCLLRPPDAQRFAAQAGTEVGKRIAAVIIEHHNAYQRMRFERDTTELARLIGAGELRPLQIVAEALRRADEELAHRPTRDEVRALVEEVARSTPARRVVLRIEDVRLLFRVGVNDYARRVAEQHGIQANAVAHDINQRLKFALGNKARDNWTISDFVVAARLFEAWYGEPLTPNPFEPIEVDAAAPVVQLRLFGS